MKVIPREDRVLILQDDPKKETESGLAIPETAQKKPSSGTIVTIGPGRAQGKELPIGYMLNDKFTDSLIGKTISEVDRVVPVYSTDIQVGDKVLFALFAGVPVEVDGKPHLIMRFSDIICRV